MKPSMTPTARRSDYAFNPTNSISTEVFRFAGLNGTGTLTGETIDNTNTTSQVYAFNPVSGISEEITNYVGPDGTGAPVGEVVDDTNGTSQVRRLQSGKRCFHGGLQVYRSQRRRHPDE